jgi:hypothetical protein
MRNLGKLPLKYSILFLFILFVSACEDKDTTPPGVVMNLTATGEEGQASLTWTEPVDSDLSSIEITQTPPDRVYSQPGGQNGATITGLTNGTSYDFAVVAVDEEGNKSSAVHVSVIPNTPFVVVDPDPDDYEPSVHVTNNVGYQTTIPSATFGVNTMGAVYITVTFNRAVDVSSVLAGQTIYFEGDTISPGNVVFSEDNKTVTFTSTDIFSSFGTTYTIPPSFAYVFDFILVGDDEGYGMIRDSNGMVFDGDQDGTPGGNFVLEDLSVREDN